MFINYNLMIILLIINIIMIILIKLYMKNNIIILELLNYQLVLKQFIIKIIKLKCII